MVSLNEVLFASDFGEAGTGRGWMPEGFGKAGVEDGPVIGSRAWKHGAPDHAAQARLQDSASGRCRRTATVRASLHQAPHTSDGSVEGDNELHVVVVDTHDVAFFDARWNQLGDPLAFVVQRSVIAKHPNCRLVA